MRAPPPEPSATTANQVSTRATPRRATPGHDRSIHPDSGVSRAQASRPRRGDRAPLVSRHRRTGRLRARSDAYQRGRELEPPRLLTHLRSADLFDLAAFPHITFRSTQVESTGADTLRITGDLTIRGVTKPVVLDATLNGAGKHPMSGRPAIGFDATTTVKRSDFGLDYAVPAVSDEIAIRITTEGVAAP